MQERPANLKPDYYRYILRRFTDLTDVQLRTHLQTYGYPATEETDRIELESLVMGGPSPFLSEDYQALNKPDALSGTIICFEDGKKDADVDRLIDQTAAEAIALGQRSAILRRIDDNTPFLIPVDRIRGASKTGCSLDYLDRR